MILISLNRTQWSQVVHAMRAGREAFEELSRDRGEPFASDFQSYIDETDSLIKKIENKASL